ncbi:MAG: hypothetical protein PWQ51_779 [Methanolobus sp.]|jgi:hypothetical protein|uniref:Uncharacterized protein n=2 Tax=Methanolobus TaxID=2220 RepID=W9DZE3_METTI|nr:MULTISPECIES: hypothetical protein [Methanolobus]ETA69042.1 hypothetical protein MettiDRAFT_2532 [Methanolobus tindarius DSM 2278]MDI3485116.1 hypothetical protein [Methanolobus sp.]MDK2832771.1 hypothetical protein [Methanolobus sp.]MDK2938615.1 hypothetical protein [Methanolobus sp.]
MKLTAFLIIVLIMSLFWFSASNDLISNGEEYLHFNQFSMRFQGTDVVITVSYDMDMFSSIYISLLGTHNLEPAIENLFYDFENFEVLEIGRNNAVVFVKDVSRKNDEYYLYDAHDLNGTVDMLTMVFPDGSSQSFMDASSTEPTFYYV